MVASHAVPMVWDLGMLHSLQLWMSAPAFLLCILVSIGKGTQLQWADPGITPDSIGIKITKDLQVHACPTVIGAILAGYN